jgi:hypothetical protein
MTRPSASHDLLFTSICRIQVTASTVAAFRGASIGAKHTVPINI